MDRERAIALLDGLVRIRSLSGEEREASTWLAARAKEAGYDRAFVDSAGNAVAELGDERAPRVVVLLGHIDTVPGEVPVRFETRGGDSTGADRGATVLYGRGTVDAKGPLATFVAAGARLGPAWARAAGVRLVVVGAVEEEAASSKGARFIAARFDGGREPVPAACVIGEPSRWDRVTIGYKGRLLIDLEARRSMTHSAGPERTAGTAAVGLWNRVEAFCTAFNQGREKAFDQLLPSLRSINTSSDGLEERATCSIGLRLPLDFDPAVLRAAVGEWASSWPSGAVEIAYRGYEPTWRGDARNALARSVLAAIRAQQVAGAKPALVVKTGTSDMNVVGPAWRCPILAYGPGDSRLDHTPIEHVELDEYWRAVMVLERALRSVGDQLAAERHSTAGC